MFYSKDELKCCSTDVGDNDGEVCTFFIRPVNFKFKGWQFLN